MDVVELDRMAVRKTECLVNSIAGRGQWGLPTPCAEWNLKDLVGHMAGQHEGFAAAADGRGAMPDVWQEPPLGAEPATVYAESAGKVVRAFGEPGVLERQFTLPEVHPEASFPGSVAIGFHLLDHVVHGWDVAAALGVPFTLPEPVLSVALAVARQVPDDEGRLASDALFGPVRPAGAGASDLECLLGLAGRSPRWPEG